MAAASTLRSWIIWFLISAAATGISVAYVDRPLALFLDANVRHTEFWSWLSPALYPFVLLVPVALFFLLGCGLWLISGRKLPEWTDTPLACSWAAMWATAAEHIFKQIFGRGWPDPTFVRDHLQGFHFLHGETHWDSFPSGTATISFAILLVLWVRKPNWRIASVAIVTLLLIAVVVGNYHWFSDLIAGVYLGALIGRSTESSLRH